MLPEVGESIPVSRLISVVLPLPDFPMTATNSPCRTSKFKSCKATMGPASLSKCLLTSVIEISVMAATVEQPIEPRDIHGASGATLGVRGALTSGSMKQIGRVSAAQAKNPARSEPKLVVALEKRRQRIDLGDVDCNRFVYAYELLFADLKKKIGESSAEKVFCVRSVDMHVIVVGLEIVDAGGLDQPQILAGGNQQPVCGPGLRAGRAYRGSPMFRRNQPHANAVQGAMEALLVIRLQ